MSKKSNPPAPNPGVSSPELDALEGYSRFVYIPGTGMFAGSKHAWEAKEPSSFHHAILHSSPSLSRWIVEHPMAVIYAMADDKVTPGKQRGISVVAIFMGGTPLSDAQAKAMTPQFSWYVAPSASESDGVTVEMGEEADPNAELHVEVV